MTLQEYTLRASEDRGETFRDGSPVVTALAYFFRDAATYDAKFLHLQGALLETWRHCGKLKTVVVTNQVSAALAKFAARYPWVEVQVEPSLVPGDIDTLSRDCISKLGERFVPPEVAGRFSIEHNLDFMPKDEKPLGFHYLSGWAKWWAS